MQHVYAPRSPHRADRIARIPLTHAEVGIALDSKYERDEAEAVAMLLDRSSVSGSVFRIAGWIEP